MADPKARDCLLGKLGAARAGGDRVALIVSAMGRKGAPYATDTLLGLIDEASGQTEASARTRDLLASCGETIATCYVASLLSAHGIPAAPLTAYTAGIQAGGPFGNAELLSVDAERVMTVINAGVVPVITGFQAVNPDGDVVTLGRGGSDTSAVAVGAAIGADYVDIFTDVPGVAIADPRIVPEAPYLAQLDYHSMFRLASNGARVLHDRSALLGQRYGVRIRVRSTFDDGEGTLISAAPLASSLPAVLGITSSLKRGEAVVTVVCAPGMGKELLPLAEAVAQSAGAVYQGPSSDPDALSFSCEAERATSLVRSLFSALVVS